MTHHATASMIAGAHAVKTGVPLHAQFNNGRVVNLGRSAEKHDEAFVFGSFKRLGDANGCCLGGGDFLNDQGEVIAHRVFRVAGGSIQCLLGDGGHQRFAIFEATDAACGDEMLSIVDGVVEQVLNPAGGVGDGKTLSHGYLPIFVKVAEGPATAQTGLDLMLTAFDDQTN